MIFLMTRHMKVYLIFLKRFKAIFGNMRVFIQHYCSWLQSVVQLGYPGAKSTFAPPPTKTAKSEEKNRRKSAEEAKADYLLL